MDVDNGRFFRRHHLSRQLRIDLGLEQAGVKAASCERRKVDDGDVGLLFTTIANDKIADAQWQRRRTCVVTACWSVLGAVLICGCGREKRPCGI